METIFYFLKDNFPILFSYKYFFVFAGSAIEGFNVQILSGFLVGVGALKIVPTLLVTIAGQFANGFMWYGVGYFAGAKPLDYWANKHEKGRKILSQVNEYFGRHSGKALVFTRLTVSFTVATLITAGSLKYDLRKFSLYNLIGGTCWAIITLGFGYFFGESFSYVFKYVADATLIFLALILVGLLIYFIFKFANKSVVRIFELNALMHELGDKVIGNVDRFLAAKEDGGPVDKWNGE